jgi:hypothetical protein
MLEEVLSKLLMRKNYEKEFPGVGKTQKKQHVYRHKFLRGLVCDSAMEYFFALRDTTPPPSLQAQ